jgi:hypothetical protein
VVNATNVTATLEVSDGCCNATDSKTVEICSQCKLRLYGTFGEGAGDDTVTDENGYYPENWPYTEPQGPFYPQHEQAPRKDFITFNPAIMEHNDGYDGLTFYDCEFYPEVQQGNEKVFKRMWYEKEWFKDHSTAAGYGDNCYTVVIDKWDDETGWEYDRTMCLEDWNAMPGTQCLTGRKPRTS